MEMRKKTATKRDINKYFKTTFNQQNLPEYIKNTKIKSI